MDKFIKLSSIATPFLHDDIDTDVIYPGRYLKVVERTGLQDYGFEAIRFHPDGKINPDAIFNQKPYDSAEILLAGNNFGCGSSREHAVWTIMQMGYKCIIAKGLGDIFRSNCYKNGLLPIELGADDVNWIAEHGDKLPIEVDLEKEVISAANKQFKFEIAPQHKYCLLEGLDQISLTLREGKAIKAFEGKQSKEMPWLYSVGEAK